ncbi:MAG: hypothetical protein KUG79_18295 [Pseudomonadales bacterium]|nr:hypothetical protein [Pseudomonadales bacterium]
MLSEYALVGVIELFGIFLVIICALVLANRKLVKRIDQLSEWLTKLKGTTRTLIEEANTAGHRYKENLSLEIEDTKRIFEKFSPGSILAVNQDQSTSSQAIALRHKFLEIELAAHKTADEDEKWRHLTNTLGTIVDGIDIPNKKPEKNSKKKSKRSEQAKQWKSICEAAVQVVHNRSNDTEAHLIDLLHDINKDLGLEALNLPSKNKSPHSSSPHNLTSDVSSLKDISGQQQSLIDNLLAQRNAAEAEITIKADELISLQRFLAESDLCIQTLEQELDTLQNNMKQLSLTVSENHDMKESMNNFAVETVELLGCIEVLEAENEQLREQIDHR